MTEEGVFSHLITEIYNIPGVTEELSEMPGQFEIKQDTRLVDLGINSVDYAGIIYNLSMKWDLNLSAESFVNAYRVQEVVHLIYNKIVETADV